MLIQKSTDFLKDWWCAMTVKSVSEKLFRYLDYKEAFRCARTNTLIPRYFSEIDGFTNLSLAEYYQDLTPVTFELNGYLVSRYYFIEPVGILGRPGIFFNRRVSDKLYKVPAVKELNRFLDRIFIDVSFRDYDERAYYINQLIKYGTDSGIPVELF